MKTNERTAYKGKRTSCILLLLTSLLSTLNLYANSLIDHVTSVVHENQEIIRLYFNQPVHYLYHTPHRNTKTVLLGFSIASGTQQLSRHRAIAFKPEKYLQNIEIYYERDFNPHLFLEFNQAVNITVQPTQNLRGFILILNKNDQ